MFEHVICVGGSGSSLQQLCNFCAGETLETNDGHAHDIPADTFDTGDGYFDPQTGNVMSYDGETVLRTPAKDETKWITDTCRTGPSSASS